MTDVQLGRVPATAKHTIKFACALWLLGSYAACAAAGTDKTQGAAGSPSLIVGAGAGGGSAASGKPSGEGTACTANGSTRTCCGGGTQTCSGTVEFLTWGACLDAKGMAVDCTVHQPSGCGMGEFAGRCQDAGTSHACGEGEFSAACEQPALCKDRTINTEPEILAAYAPTSGESVGADGQIHVWVNDERPALIAPGEQVDATNGGITMPGDRTAKAPDGYLWEPALYISPQTAENGGTPHFPQTIRGWYNNMPPYVRGSKAMGVEVPAMDAAPAGTQLAERYTTEFTWDVGALGLRPGSYGGEFVIHDGDRDRAIGCVTIKITQ